MRKLIQRVRVEYYIIIAFALTFVSFVIPSYSYNQGLGFGYRVYNLFNYIFHLDVPIGILFFTIAFGGYAAAFLYCTNDNHYSKRAKRSFRFATWFLLIFAVLIFIWVITASRIDFLPGIIVFLVTLIFIAFISFLYREYDGEKNPSLFGGKVKEEETDLEKYPQLKELQNIYEEGIISEEEFEQKRKELLYLYIQNENKLTNLKKPKGFLLTIILGIIGIILSLPILAYLGFVVSCMGLIYVNKIMKMSKKATAGLVLNVIALGFTIISLLATIIIALAQQQISIPS